MKTILTISIALSLLTSCTDNYIGCDSECGEVISSALRYQSGHMFNEVRVLKQCGNTYLFTSQEYRVNGSFVCIPLNIQY